MNLYPEAALERVLGTLVQGLRLRGPDPSVVPAGKRALGPARARLEAGPVVDRFHPVCCPLATAATPGAFRFGLRLLGRDGSTEPVPETPANARLWPAARRA